MEALAALGKVASAKGFASSGQRPRKPIVCSEHQLLLLPPELVKADGSLDVYPDVLKLFRPTYDQNRPAIQTTGWVGYIPLNDTIALEISPRVPVGNLERLVSMALGYAPNILKKYTRQFAQAADQPASLFDVLSDQILDAFDQIWEIGLLKCYSRIERKGSSPVGRIMPFSSEWHTAKAGRPVAVSSAFHRTPDFGPNRLLRHAFEKLLSRYLDIGADRQRARIHRLKKAIECLADIGWPSASEVTPKAIALYVQQLPAQHEHYADALMVAQLIIYDAGLAIRGPGGVATLPSILIDMAKAFEDYIRRVLVNGLSDDNDVEVKDGNKGGDDGAKVSLFDPAREGLANPPVTPDIVIYVRGKARLVVDVKYKNSPAVPDRNDINQVILYGARYGVDRVMVLHAGRPDNRDPTESCGNVGQFQLFNGMVDLDAASITAEEASFVEAVRNLL